MKPYTIYYQTTIIADNIPSLNLAYKMAESICHPDYPLDIKDKDDDIVYNTISKQFYTEHYLLGE